MFIRLKLIIKIFSIVVIFFYGIMIIDDEVVAYFDKDNSGVYFEEKDNYLLRLIIPKIGFDRYVYDFDSELNDVNYNVELLESSNVDSNVYFLAGHSGNGDNCYFNKIKELDIGDDIYIDGGKNWLVYEVVDKYNIVKSGYMEVDECLEDVLFLITCIGYNRQLIVKGVLIN